MQSGTANLALTWNSSGTVNVNGTLNASDTIYADAGAVNNGALKPGLVFGGSGQHRRHFLQTHQWRTNTAWTFTPPTPSA